MRQDNIFTYAVKHVPLRVPPSHGSFYGIKNNDTLSINWVPYLNNNEELYKCPAYNNSWFKILTANFMIWKIETEKEKIFINLTIHTCRIINDD